jgi:hypothetical protein
MAEGVVLLGELVKTLDAYTNSFSLGSGPAAPAPAAEAPAAEPNSPTATT